jgi:hypothetical protein
MEVPAVTGYPTAVKRPPAPPPPPMFVAPPPPATTRYSTVVTGELMPSSPTERMPPTLSRDISASDYGEVIDSIAAVKWIALPVPTITPTD